MLSENLLVNGRGRFTDDQFNYNPKYNLTQTAKNNFFKENNYDKLPLSTFFVTKGKRYRFRVIYFGFTYCPVMVHIEEHDMTIIATDASPVRPKKVKSFIIHSGQR